MVTLSGPRSGPEPPILAVENEVGLWNPNTLYQMGDFVRWGQDIYKSKSVIPKEEDVDAEFFSHADSLNYVNTHGEQEEVMRNIDEISLLYFINVD